MFLANIYSREDSKQWQIIRFFLDEQRTWQEKSLEYSRVLILIKSRVIIMQLVDYIPQRHLPLLH